MKPRPGDYICGGSGKLTPEAEIELADIAAYLKAKSEKTFSGKYVDWRKAYPLNLRGSLRELPHRPETAE